MNSNIVLDITTTSVGRNTIKTAYESFFENVIFSGMFDIHVTIDPAYGVGKEEIEDVVEYLENLKSREYVNSVDVIFFEKPVGLEKAITMLFSQCENKFGVNLEDDWRFFNQFNIDNFLLDLEQLDSTMIVFSSTHVANRGTFNHSQGVELVASVREKYKRLIPPNWASDYIPLAPNIHVNKKWSKEYLKGLFYDQHSERCPDERTKEYIRVHGLREIMNVLWTDDIVVEDIGRSWLAEHNKSKSILPQNEISINKFDKLDSLKGFLRSENMYSRALKTIPGQTETYMKRGEELRGIGPLYAEKGLGSHFVDVDGNSYIDYVAGLGVLQLGYCHPAMTEAVLSHLNKGVYFSLPTWYEIEASELIRQMVPNAEMTRFLKSGGDACSAAVTLARYITGKQKIVSCGYHGWHEQFNPYQPGANAELEKSLKLFDIEKDCIGDIIKENSKEIACIIIAVPYRNVLSKKVFKEIRSECDKNGILLILDDVVTGFRLAVGGAQSFFDFDADLVIMSKALAAGAELAAVSGKREYMHHFEKLYVSTTMGGEVTALQCMINAVNIYRDTDLINRTHILGRRLKDNINKISNRYIGKDIILGYDCMPFLEIDEMGDKRCLIKYLMKNGIYMRLGCNFITCVHTENDIKKTEDVFENYFKCNEWGRND